MRFHLTRLILPGVFLSGAVGLLVLAAFSEAGADSSGCVNVDVTALVADPRDPRTLYAGTRYDGVFKSVDGGISWRGVTDAGLEDSIHSLAVDPVDSFIL